jgi:hypothetical protein
MIEGLERLIMYVFLTPTVLRRVLFLGLILVGVAVVPSAMYLYPFWKGTVTSESALFQVDELCLNVIVTRPTRLLPEYEKHELILEVENLCTEAMSVTVSIDKDQPYVHLIDQEILPIAVTRKVPPASRIVERFSFSVDGSTKPCRPTEFVLNVQNSLGSFNASFAIPVDHLSVPVIAVVGLFLPLIVIILRLIGQLLK